MKRSLWRMSLCWTLLLRSERRLWCLYSSHWQILYTYCRTLFNGMASLLLSQIPNCTVNVSWITRELLLMCHRTLHIIFASEKDRSYNFTNCHSVRYGLDNTTYQQIFTTISYHMPQNSVFLWMIGPNYDLSPWVPMLLGSRKPGGKAGKVQAHVDGLLQEGRNSIANALELHALTHRRAVVRRSAWLSQ